MDFHCAITGELGHHRHTLVFTEKEERLKGESLLSDVILYRTESFEVLRELADRAYSGSGDPDIPQRFAPRDGFMTIEPPDLVYDYCILEYRFPATDRERVLSAFGIDRLFEHG